MSISRKTFSNSAPKEIPASFLRTRKLAQMSMFTALAIVLHVLELSIPNPLPWLRLGLANIIILTILVLYGLWEGLTVNVFRIVLGGFITGTLFGPAFWLGISGGLVSTLAMWLAYVIAGRYMSPVGLSLVGSYTHTLTQLGVAYFLLIQHRGLFLLLPFFLTAALFSGFITGIAALVIIEHLRKLSLSYT